MKKTLSVLCLIAAFLVCLPLTSCGNSKKENLVGKWKYSMTMSEDGVDMELSGSFTFNKDGSYRHDFVMPLQQEEDGIAVSMTVKGYQSGEWDVIGSDLYTTINSCDAKLTRAKFYNEWLGSYDATGSDLRELENEIIPGFVSSIQEDEVNEITTLTSNTLVLNDDGVTLTCTRVQ